MVVLTGFVMCGCVSVTFVHVFTVFCIVCTVLLHCSVYVYLFFVFFFLILQVMYYYCYVYVFLLLCMFCFKCSVFILPTGTHRLP